MSRIHHMHVILDEALVAYRAARHIDQIEHAARCAQIDSATLISVARATGTRCPLFGDAVVVACPIALNDLLDEIHVRAMVATVADVYSDAARTQMSVRAWVQLAQRLGARIPTFTMRTLTTRHVLGSTSATSYTPEHRISAARVLSQTQGRPHWRRVGVERLGMTVARAYNLTSGPETTLAA